MTETVEKILEFKDLFPQEESLDVSAVLKKYSKELWVKSCHVLSNNYRSIMWFPDAMYPFFTQKTSAVEKLEGKIKKYLELSDSKRVCYSTLRTILELLRHVFSVPNSEYSNSCDKDDFEYDLFRVLLQLNTKLMDFKSAQQQELDVLMFFLHYVTNDVSIDDYRCLFGEQIMMYHSLSEVLESDIAFKEVKDELLKKLGVSSMKEYAKTWLFLCKCVNDYHQQNKKCCPILNYEDFKENCSISEVVLNYLSIDINCCIEYDTTKMGERDNNVDYRMFRAHPLVKIADGQYLIYNFQILVERLYNGLFFDMKEFMGTNPFQFYNTKFVERRLFQPQMLKCINTKKTSFFYPSRKEISEDPDRVEKDCMPDFYIREGENLIIFECKANLLKGELKDNADVDDLMSTIKNKLYHSVKDEDNHKSQNKNKGVTQLVYQIKMIEDNSVSYDTGIPDEVRYYPVIVLHDSRLVVPGISSIINRWYKDSLKENNLLEIASCPIIVLSLYTLVKYKDTFFQRGFHNVFDEYIEFVTHYEEDGIHWKFDPMADFDCFMNSKPVHKKMKRIFKSYARVFGINES